MKNAQPHSDFIEDGYISTIHWATAQNGFDSLITAHNYYGFAFPGLPKDKTDAEITVDFFGEDGTLWTSIKKEIATNASLHLSTDSVAKNFQGLVALRMVPKGRMPRIKDTSGRPIASSFFMLYRLRHNFLDFSHELFPVKKAPDAREAEWSTVVYGGQFVEPSVIAMNNRPGSSNSSNGSRVKVRLLSLDSSPLTPEVTFDLPPGGSRLVELKQIFPKIISPTVQATPLLCCVRSKNIEQPMSLHRHKSGDFNVHHF